MINFANNLVSDDTCPGLYNNSDPMLSLPKKYRGPTHAMALMPGSTAIEQGTPPLCPVTDHRGILRTTDIRGASSGNFGAYEYLPVTILLSCVWSERGGLGEAGLAYRDEQESI